MNSDSPRISLITAVYNRASTVAATIDSVLCQSWPHLEYIVVDGNSTDGTDRVVERYADRIARIVREPDHGIYDALNKGIALASGDVVGFLHADDLLAGPEVLSRVAAAFADPEIQASYGDLTYVDADDPGRVIRYWRSGSFRPESFRWGWMPPHPTLYLRRGCYHQFGGFRSDFSISADYELMLRMLYRHRIHATWIPEVLVRMRVGGKSNASIGNRLQANREDRIAWQVNGYRPPWGLRLTKPLRKVPQYFCRPPGSG